VAPSALDSAVPSVQASTMRAHPFAEARSDRHFVFRAAILDHIVQQSGDGLVFVAAVLDHQAADAEQVGRGRE
jgi:hypothetical protein